MDPLALLPYALAATGGRVDAHDLPPLVAAGVTLLQRSAPLVRALAGRRAAIWLPVGPAWFVALAASDGRGALLPDVGATDASWAAALAAANVGAVFTTQSRADRLPPDMPRVLLDDIPRRASVIVGDRRHDVDLGSHFGLHLTGDATGPGALEECLGVAGQPFRTHADILGTARSLLTRIPFTPLDRTLVLGTPTELPGLCVALVAPLLAGGTLCTTPAAREGAPAGDAGASATMIVTNAAALPTLGETLGAVGSVAEGVRHLVVYGPHDEAAFASLVTRAAQRGVAVSRV